MNLAARCALICFCCFCYTGILNAATPYDDFSGSQIDENKWGSGDRLEHVREISGGKLLSKIRVVTPDNVNYVNRTNFTDANLKTKIEATVSVDSYSLDNDPAVTSQAVIATIGGTFYEDTNGFVMAYLGISDSNDGNGIRAGCKVIEESGVEIVQYFSGITITLGNPYILSIRYNSAAGEFVYSIKDVIAGTQDEITIVQPTVRIGDPGFEYKTLMTAYLLDNNTTLAHGSISATFDDVMVNGNPYDDFSSAPLDGSRWMMSEKVREIRDGKLQMNRQNFGTDRETCDLTLLPTQVTDYFQADVTIDSDTVLTGDNTVGEIRLMGTYYNYKYNGSGYNGDDGEIAAVARVRRFSDGRLKPYVSIWRCENASCDNDTGLFYREFSCDVQLDTPVTLAIEKKGSTLVFSCDQDQFSHELSGPLYDSADNLRKLRSRVYSAPGEYGYLKATADNVFTTKSSPWNLFMPAILTGAQK